MVSSIQRDIEIRIRAWNLAEKALRDVALEVEAVAVSIENVDRASSEASIAASIFTAGMDRESQEAGALALRLSMVDKATGTLSTSSFLLGRTLEYVDNHMKGLELQADLGALATARLEEEAWQASIAAERLAFEAKHAGVDIDAMALASDLGAIELERLAKAAEAAASFEQLVGEAAANAGKDALFTSVDFDILNATLEKTRRQTEFTAADFDILAKMLEKEAVTAEIAAAANNHLSRSVDSQGKVLGQSLLRWRNWSAGVVTAIALITPTSLIIGGLIVALASLALTLGAVVGAFAIFGGAVFLGMRKIGEITSQAKTFDRALNQIAIAGAIAGQQLEAHFFGPSSDGIHKLTSGILALIQHMEPIVQKLGDMIVAYFKKWGPTILTIVQTWASLLSHIFAGAGAALMNLFIILQPVAIAIVKGLSDMLEKIFISTKHILEPLIPLTVAFVTLLTKDIAGAVGIYQKFGAVLDFVGVALLKLGSQIIPVVKHALADLIPVMQAVGFAIVLAAQALGFFLTHFPKISAFIVVILILAKAFTVLKKAIIESAAVSALGSLIGGLRGVELIAGQAVPLMYRLGTALRALAATRVGAFFVGLGVNIGTVLGPIGLFAGLMAITASTAKRMSNGVDEAIQTVYKFGAASKQGQEAIMHMNATATLVSRTFRGFSIDSMGVGKQLRQNIADLKNWSNGANEVTDSMHHLLDSGLTPLLQGTVEYQKALTDVGIAQKDWNQVIHNAGILSDQQRHDMQMLARVSGTTFAQIKRDAKDAYEQGGNAFTTFMQTQIDGWHKFRDAVVGALGDGSTVFQQFADQGKVSFDKVNTALNDLLKNQRTVFADWKTILKKGGEDAKPMVAALAQMGLSGKGLSDALAGLPVGKLDDFVRRWNLAHKQAGDIGSVITTKLLGPLNQMVSILTAIGIALGAKIPADILQAYLKMVAWNSAAQAVNKQVAAINAQLDATHAKIQAVAGQYGVVFTISVDASKLGFALAYKEFHFAKGGIIREHVIGYGTQTGARYDIGEAGPERIVPEGAGLGAQPVMAASATGGDTHLHFHGAYPTPAEIMADLTWWESTHRWSN